MNNKTILIVDDDEMIIDEFQSLFEEEGYKTVLACNGEDALTKFKNNKVDIILSDIKMPVMDGVEFVKELKGTGDTTPTVFMTGYSDYSETDLLNLGVNAVLFKPFDVDSLLQTISDLVE